MTRRLLSAIASPLQPSPSSQRTDQRGNRAALLACCVGAFTITHAHRLR